MQQHYFYCYLGVWNNQICCWSLWKLMISKNLFYRCEITNGIHNWAWLWRHLFVVPWDFKDATIIEHVELSTCDPLVFSRTSIFISEHEQLRKVFYDELGGQLYFLYYFWWVVGDTVVMRILTRDPTNILIINQQRSDSLSCWWATSKMVVFIVIYYAFVRPLNLSKTLYSSILLPSPVFTK